MKDRDSDRDLIMEGLLIAAGVCLVLFILTLFIPYF